MRGSNRLPGLEGTLELFPSIKCQTANLPPSQGRCTGAGVLSSSEGQQWGSVGQGSREAPFAQQEQPQGWPQCTSHCLAVPWTKSAEPRPGLAA